jgi:hypothetical protein
MRTSNEDVAIKAWKHQIDGAAHVVEAVTEGSLKIGEAQLKAAAEANTRMDTARRQLEKATNAGDLWRIHSEWMAANLQKSLEYWSDVNRAAVETQSSVMKYLVYPVGALGPQATAIPEASRTALVGMMDDAYRRWRESTLQFYAAAKTTGHKAKQEA